MTRRYRTLFAIIAIVLSSLVGYSPAMANDIVTIQTHQTNVVSTEPYSSEFENCLMPSRKVLAQMSGTLPGNWEYLNSLRRAARYEGKQITIQVLKDQMIKVGGHDYLYPEIVVTNRFTIGCWSSKPNIFDPSPASNCLNTRSRLAQNTGTTMNDWIRKSSTEALHQFEYVGNDALEMEVPMFSWVDVFEDPQEPWFARYGPGYRIKIASSGQTAIMVNVTCNH